MPGRPLSSSSPAYTCYSSKPSRRSAAQIAASCLTLRINVDAKQALMSRAVQERLKTGGCPEAEIERGLIEIHSAQKAMETQASILNANKAFIRNWA